MQSVDLIFHVSEIKKKLLSIEQMVADIKAHVKPADDLWDNADIIRNWHISPRTLADWRSKGIIGYIQVGNKIWYPRQAREEFLCINYVKTKHHEL